MFVMEDSDATGLVTITNLFRQLFLTDFVDAMMVIRMGHVAGP